MGTALRHRHPSKGRSMTKDLDKKVAYAMELHYERGFIDGMQKQMQSSVDKAVNRMAQTELCKYGQEPKSCTSNPMDCQCAIDAALAQEQDVNAIIIQYHEATIKRLEKRIGELLASLPQRTWVGLTDEEIQVVAKQARSKDHAVTLTNKLLRDKNA